MSMWRLTRVGESEIIHASHVIVSRERGSWVADAVGYGKYFTPQSGPTDRVALEQVCNSNE